MNIVLQNKKARFYIKKPRHPDNRSRRCPKRVMLLVLQPLLVYRCLAAYTRLLVGAFQDYAETTIPQTVRAPFSVGLSFVHS